MYCEYCTVEFAEETGVAECSRCGGILDTEPPGYWSTKCPGAATADRFRASGKRLLLSGATTIAVGVLLGMALGRSWQVTVSVLGFILGYVQLVTAATFYARGKGHPWFKGLLVMMGWIGWILFARLDDRVIRL